MHSPSAIVHYPASHFRPTVDHEVDYAHPKSVLRGFAEVDKVEQGSQGKNRVMGINYCSPSVGVHMYIHLQIM